MIAGTLARSFIIIAASVVLAAGYASVMKRPWAPTPEQLQKEKNDLRRREDARKHRAELEKQAGISLKDLQGFISQGQAIFVDARERKLFDDGHLKTPTIVNIPESDVKNQVARLTPDVVAGREIVLYCNGLDCPAAEVVYAELQQLFGHDRMFIYFEGWDGIMKHKLPTTTGPESDLNPAFIGMWPEEVAALQQNDSGQPTDARQPSGDQP
ncbi:MAG: rhodanese-like domain-containing protein [Phycisphaerales bacterium]|nr:rhodanese-like domain-containing protein [Phycisphaerales bacterium]